MVVLPMSPTLSVIFFRSEPADDPALRERLPAHAASPHAERRVQGQPHRGPGARLRPRPRHEAEADARVRHPLCP